MSSSIASSGWWLPFATSSDDVVLVVVVGSVAGANHTRRVRFIERFAEAAFDEHFTAGRVRPR